MKFMDIAVIVFATGWLGRDILVFWFWKRHPKWWRYWCIGSVFLWAMILFWWFM